MRSKLTRTLIVVGLICTGPAPDAERADRPYLNPGVMVVGLAAAFRAQHRKHALKAMLPGIAGRALLHPWTLLSVPLSVVSARVYLWWNGFKVTAPNNRSLPNKLP